MFKHTQPTGVLPPLKAKNVDGKRFYEHIETGEKYPSITSVLSIRQKEGRFYTLADKDNSLSDSRVHKPGETNWLSDFDVNIAKRMAAQRIDQGLEGASRDNAIAEEISNILSEKPSLEGLIP